MTASPTHATPLDVLLVEHARVAAAAAVEQLESAGHRVHRCYPTERPGASRVAPEDRYLCTGVTAGTCPIDGGIDVALLVRHGLATRPAAREGAVTCALRAGVPVVEQGPETLDPFAPWIAGRVSGDAAAACEAASEAAFATLRDAILGRLRAVLEGAGVDASAVSCTFERDGSRLHVIVSGPRPTARFEQVVAVRVLDAVRAGARRYDHVDVSYRTREA